MLPFDASIDDLNEEFTRRQEEHDAYIQMKKNGIKPVTSRARYEQQIHDTHRVEGIKRRDEMLRQLKDGSDMTSSSSLSQQQQEATA